MRYHSRALGLVALILGTLAGCGTTEPSSSSCDAIAGALVARIEVTPATAEVFLGDSLRLNAVAYSCSGVLGEIRTFQWQTEEPAVATVGADGLVKAASSGTTTVLATVQGKEGSATVTTTQVPVASVVVEPDNSVIGVGRTSILTARAFDSRGRELTGRGVTWTSADEAVATVTAAGAVTGVTVGGPVAITATIEGRSAASQVTVTQVPVNSVEVSPSSATVAAGDVVPLSAILRDDLNNVLTQRAVNWTSSNTTIATVTGAGGVVTGHRPGSATITATSEGKSGTASITVIVGPPAKLAFGQQPGAVETGIALSPPVTVEVQDAGGNRVTTANTAVTIALASANGSTLSGTLTVMAVNGLATFADLSVNAAGVYQLKATAGGLSSTTSVSFAVTARPAVRLAYVQQPVSTQAGSSPGNVSIELLDAGGARATGETRSITLTLTGGDGSATLDGTVTQTTVNGVAIFPDLSVTRSGSGYTLVASTNGLQGATSQPFAITPGPAARVQFITQPCPDGCKANATLLPEPQVAVQDAFGNLISGSSALIIVGAEGGSRAVVLSGIVLRTAAGGIATYPNLSINRDSKHVHLRATSLGLSAAVSDDFDITK